MDKQDNQQEQQEQFNPTLVFNLTLVDVNAVLGAIAKAPLEQVFNVYLAIRSEAERQIAAIQANAEQTNEPEAGE